MLYLIGLGLNVKGISKEGLLALKDKKKIYLESYTVDFPYDPKEFEEMVGVKLILVDREFVESFKVLDEAEENDVVLLVYGSPLIATTHISLIQEAKKRKIKYKTIHSASVLDAIAETGLQIYKFGKIASIPNFQADSFFNVIKENQEINAHTLVLVDIGLEFKDALNRLEKIKPNKIVVCSRLGMGGSKIFYNTIENLKEKNIEKPFSLIIPGKLHFLEEEILGDFY